MAKIKLLAPLLGGIVFLISLIVSVTPWWPNNSLLLVPKYLLLFGPRWWLIFVAILTLLSWRLVSTRIKALLVISFLLSINYLDFQLPSFKYIWASPLTDERPFRIISANIGGGGSMHEIQLLVSEYDPDILLLQEARRVRLNSWLQENYKTHCNSGLCIASKLIFEHQGEVDRKLINGWGNFANLYKIHIGEEVLELANIHLETPRTVISSVLSGEWDWRQALEVEDNRRLESSLISSWSAGKEHVIIAGDFNMVEDENIYQTYFSQLNNAVGDSGIGINYTKLTSWHGVRIDHILTSDMVVVTKTRVLDSITGDHRPVLAEFLFLN